MSVWAKRRLSPSCLSHNAEYAHICKENAFTGISTVVPNLKQHFKGEGKKCFSQMIVKRVCCSPKIHFYNIKEIKCKTYISIYREPAVLPFSKGEHCYQKRVGCIYCFRIVLMVFFVCLKYKQNITRMWTHAQFP